MGGLSCFAELRTITQKLRQSVCELDSITCRATFGDSRCGVDAEALFVSGAVTNVGSESDRIFTDTATFYILARTICIKLFLPHRDFMLDPLYRFFTSLEGFSAMCCSAEHSRVAVPAIKVGVTTLIW